MRKNLIRSLILLLALYTGSCKKDGTVVPFEHPFQVLDNAPDSLVWFDVAGTQCRDGSPTGIGVKVENKKKWMIYINGGGACFNDLTCGSNPSSFGESDMYALYGSMGDPGIFNSTDPRNPVRDWSLVFIPYCTGDVHSGVNPDAAVPGVSGTQQFVGHANFINVMEYIKPYLIHNEVDEILLFGMSAGGYGVYLNFLNVIKYFPGVKLTVINDSGPLFNDDQAFSPCLQLGFSTLYNLPLPDDLTDCCGSPEIGLANVYEYSSIKYPQYNFGFITSYKDATSRFFLSFGYNNCTGAPGNSIPGDEFQDALITLREDILKPKSTWSTFFINGNSHTMLGDDDIYYNRPAGGVYLYEWVDSLINGSRSYHLSE
jgi:Pectinacetylesterase